MNHLHSVSQLALRLEREVSLERYLSLADVGLRLVAVVLDGRVDAPARYRTKLLAADLRLDGSFRSFRSFVWLLLDFSLTATLSVSTPYDV